MDLTSRFGTELSKDTRMIGGVNFFGTGGRAEQACGAMPAFSISFHGEEDILRMRVGLAFIGGEEIRNGCSLLQD